MRRAWPALCAQRCDQEFARPSPSWCPQPTDRQTPEISAAAAARDVCDTKRGRTSSAAAAPSASGPGRRYQFWAERLTATASSSRRSRRCKHARGGLGEAAVCAAVRWFAQERVSLALVCQRLSRRLAQPDGQALWSEICFGALTNPTLWSTRFGRVATALQPPLRPPAVAPDPQEAACRSWPHEQGHHPSQR